MTHAMVRRAASRTPLDPFARALDSFFGEPFVSAVGSALEPAVSGAASAAGLATLAVDISEDDQHLFVRASLPGFQRDEISVELHEQVLTISAEREEGREELGEDERFLHRERRHTAVRRSLALPTTVSQDDVHAKLADGVLTLTLPKPTQDRPRKIEIG